ncbi:MAG: ATPase [Bryobacteraceae bacterium]|nr:ATPase [Bryobacteraceae bacterium]
MTILCLASYEKGRDFLEEAKRQGCHVILLTSASLQGTPDWPPACVDEVFYMPDDGNVWNREHTANAVSYLARTREIERIVPLDDFDVEVAAMLREHLRVPGMSESTARYFRDKLAMRMKAREAGISVPEFSGVINHGRLQRFMDRVSGPWLLKPRSMAGAIGIKKIHDQRELWPAIEQLGDRQSHYLLEQFVPGDIFHVDTVVYDREVRFAVASGYGRPPLEVSHEGGIFTTRILNRDSEIAKSLLRENARVMKDLGMLRGASHTEFIRARHDGTLYFLETSARVGGAHISDLVFAASGLNLWAEWAKVEIIGGHGPYHLPEVRDDYAGLIVSLARQQWPDTSSYSDPEIVFRMAKDHHVGLIVRSHSEQRVRELIDQYIHRIRHDFHASAPALSKPSH